MFNCLEFVQFLDEKREKLQNKNGNELFKKPIYIEGKKDNIEIECSLKWNATYSEEVLPYTNNIYQKDGGTHLLGFRSALTRVINKYANEHNLLKKNKFARLGLIKTHRGNIDTPAFMPVGTQATVKACTIDDIKKTGTEIRKSEYPYSVYKDVNEPLLKLEDTQNTGKG